jgi:toxin FitB
MDRTIATTDLFVSVITMCEAEGGIARQHATNAYFPSTPAAWLNRVLPLYSQRILPFDLHIARRWGQLNTAFGNDSPDFIISATAFERPRSRDSQRFGFRADGCFNSQSVPFAAV